VFDAYGDLVSGVPDVYAWNGAWGYRNEARPVVVDELRLPNGAFSTRNLLAYVLPDAEFESDYAGILGILEPCGDIWAVALCKRGEGQA